MNAVGNLGYRYEGITAYVYPTQLCNSVPLFRTYNAKVGDHFYTTSAPERDNAITRLNFVDEGIVGYVNPQ